MCIQLSIDIIRSYVKVYSLKLFPYFKKKISLLTKNKINNNQILKSILGKNRFRLKYYIKTENDKINGIYINENINYKFKIRFRIILTLMFNQKYGTF